MGISETLRVLAEDDTSISLEVLLEGIKEENTLLQEKLIFLFIDKNIKEGIYALIENFHTLPAQLQNILIKERRAITGFLYETSHNPKEQTRINTLDIVSRITNVELAKIIPKTLSDTSEIVRRKSIEALREIVLENISNEKKQISTGLSPYSDVLVTKRQSLIETISSAFKDYEIHQAKELINFMLMIRFESYEILYTILLGEETTLKNDLIRILRYQNSEEIGIFIISALNTRNPILVSIMEDILKNKNTQQFANELVEGLKKLDENSFKSLSNSTKDLIWWGIIEQYMTTFTSHTNKCLIDFISNTKVDNEKKVKILEKFLQIEDESVQVYVLSVFQNLPAIHTIPIVKNFISSEKEEVALMAIDTYLRSDPEDKIEILTPLLSSDLTEVRKIAAREISRESFNRYILSFDNLDEKTRRIAAAAIAKIDESMAEKLIEELQSLDPDRKVKALRIVEMIGKEKEVEGVILNLINDSDKKVRATAVKVIGLLGTVEALRVLIKMLSDPDRRTRANAIEAFEEVGDSRFAPLLLPFLEDPDNRVRANATKALWNLGYFQVKDTLESMLNSEDDKMRLSAVWALGEINYPGAKSVLKLIAESDASDTVRRKASSILEKISEK